MIARIPGPRRPRPPCARPGCTRPAAFAVTYPSGAVRALCCDDTLTSLSMASGDGLELDVRPIEIASRTDST